MTIDVNNMPTMQFMTGITCNTKTWSNIGIWGYIILFVLRIPKWCIVGYSLSCLMWRWHYCHTWIWLLPWILNDIIPFGFLKSSYFSGIENQHSLAWNCHSVFLSGQLTFDLTCCPVEFILCSQGVEKLYDLQTNQSFLQDKLSIGCTTLVSNWPSMLFLKN